MALITCPDCNNSISDQAPACPHCGRPKKREHTSQYITNRDGYERGRDQLDKLLSEGWRITNTVHEIEGPTAEGETWDVVEYFLER